jgi:formylglycine-generating enzyme
VIDQAVETTKRRRGMKRDLLLSILVLAAGLAGGCGGSGDDKIVDGGDTSTDTSTGTDTEPTDTTTGFDCSTDAGSDTDTGSDVEWVVIPGATYMMGWSTEGSGSPGHEVNVPSFEMLKTEVTAAQYKQCEDEKACSKPSPSGDPSCNRHQSGQEGHPMNCVTWQQAVDFCTWAGGRLPSEAEWEYSARSGGQEVAYPWGDDKATCDYAVMADHSGTRPGCGACSTWTVCSKTAGNTAQGLCDMSGNVYEWVEDWYHPTYDGAPTDGSAWEEPPSDMRVLRGGGFFCDESYVRVTLRWRGSPSGSDAGYGFRCAR